MTVKKKHHRSRRPVQLSHGRPPTINNAARVSLSSRATRNLIRSHHQLLKARARALEADDHELAEKLDAQIQANGGLESYQLASKTGQSLERGGDTSKVLVDWISPKLVQLKNTPFKLRVLEIGALSTKNACSRNPYLDVTRIDLHSQEPGILQQDFMERPLPSGDDYRFHLISLSLVLNYVPSPTERGEMLKRCVAFLTKSLPSGCSMIDFSPCLFLVLPAACIENSRYLTQDRLQKIMSSLGFTLAKSKVTSKLIFQLWEFNAHFEHRSFGKDILNPGKTRNNFSIILSHTSSTAEAKQ
ncbi:hypothetical protein VTN00DRAFT_990 [Thermoascus crustaceus]|uniref:uncharacterized protein n=1 Tax=Thermoascus crustaceus TaxID=5088 RepID=UPI003742DA29